MSARSRAWCFTLNNPVEALDLEGKCKYAVYQTESGENETTHYQGYIEFQNQKRMQTVKNIIGGNPHVEIRKGTREQARDYCMKEDSRISPPIEFGTWTVPGQRTDLEAIAKEVKKRPISEVADEYPGVFIRYHRGLKALKAMYNKEARGNQFIVPKIYIFTGPSGTGKTRKAYQMDPDLYKVPIHEGQTTWFDGYTNQKTILLDEFYGGIKYSFMLRLFDGYPLDVQVKGGFVRLNHKQIIVTSNKHWTEWYNIPDTHALARRINEFAFVKEFSSEMPINPVTPIRGEPVTLINDELY